MQEEIPIDIIRIGETRFEVRDELFRPDSDKIRYFIEHQMGFNTDVNWVRFKVRIFYVYPENLKDIVMDIIVETIFHIPDLKQYVTTDTGPVTSADMNIPSKILVRFADMGISHARAILAKCKAKSAFEDINLPYIDAARSAKAFFGSKIEIEEEKTIVSDGKEENQNANG
ncbi:MAG: hypothetical protein U0U70_13235 [Chitinophagaceae bacterium]